MSHFVITIQSDRDDSETMVRVDTSNGTPRVTEVSVRAPSGIGRTGNQPLAIDPDSLVRALRLGREAQRRDGQARERAETVKTAPRRAPRSAKAAAAKRTPAAKATRGRPRRATAAAAESQSRVYRRMPDDIAATYANAGTITAVANHYGVPRHTAQGWIARLRRQG